MRDGPPTPAPTSNAETNDAAIDALEGLAGTMTKLDLDVQALVKHVDTLLAGSVDRDAAAKKVASEQNRVAHPKKESGLDGLIALVESATFITFGIRSAMAATRRGIASLERHGNLADTAQGTGAARGLLAGAAEAPNLALFNALSEQARTLASQVEGLQEDQAEAVMRAIGGHLIDATNLSSALDRRMARLPLELVTRSRNALAEAEPTLAAAGFELQKQTQIMRARKAGVEPAYLRKGAEARRLLDEVMELGTREAKLLRITDIGTRHVTADLQGFETELDMEFHAMLTSSDMQIIEVLSTIGGCRDVVALGPCGWGFVIEGSDRALLAGAPIPKGGHYVRQDVVTAHFGDFIRDVPRAQWDDRASRRAWVSDAARRMTQPIEGPSIGRSR